VGSVEGYGWHGQCIAQCRKLVKTLDEKKCVRHAGGDGN
jgi:hypothetical protein